MSDWPQKFLHAFSERHHYDSVSAAHDELTLDDAYDIQHRFVALRQDAITGYKAALTAPAAQQAMGITGFTMPTMYRWVTSERGRAMSLHPFRGGHYLGSGKAEKVLEEAGIDGAGQFNGIMRYVQENG